MAISHEYKTAFLTHYGTYEWLVLPLGLTKCTGYVSKINEVNILRAVGCEFACLFR